jgi:hypothetical protein
VNANVRIFSKVFEDYGDPLVDIEVTDLRVQFRGASGGRSGGKVCTVRSRLIHEDGSYATDFEHDGASRFLLELAVLSTEIIREDWIEVTGVLLEARAWEEPFVRAEHAYKGGGPWEGVRKCERCKNPPDGDGEHWLVEHYTPPECSAIEVAPKADPRGNVRKFKPLPVYGRYVIVRWTP